MANVRGICSRHDLMVGRDNIANAMRTVIAASAMNTMACNTVAFQSCSEPSLHP